jgi:hypothetical protein
MKQTTQVKLNKTRALFDNTETVLRQPKKPSQLSRHEDFTKLHEHYQNADFNNCVEIIDRLEESYPDHPILLKYREEIEIRQTVRSVAKSHIKSKKQKKITIKLRLAAFAFLSTLVVMLSFIFSYFHLNTQVSAKQIKDETSQLAELFDQVEHLILVGKPRVAAERLAKIRAIDSEDIRLLEIESQVYDLLLLEIKYETAIALREDEKHLDALDLLREIEAEWPGLWDVPQQIKTLEGNNYR